MKQVLPRLFSPTAPGAAERLLNAHTASEQRGGRQARQGTQQQKTPKSGRGTYDTCRHRYEYDQRTLLLFSIHFRARVYLVPDMNKKWRHCQGGEEARTIDPLFMED